MAETQAMFSESPFQIFLDGLPVTFKIYSAWWLKFQELSKLKASAVFLEAFLRFRLSLWVIAVSSAAVNIENKH